MQKSALRRKASINFEAMLPDLHTVLTDAKDRWRDAFVPLVSSVVEDAGQYWNQQAGIAFDVRNLEAEASFIDYMLRFSDPIQETSEREIAALLQQGVREGWSIPKMQTAIEGMFQQWIQGDLAAADFAGERMPPYRTEMIARTESTRALNFGSRNLFKDAGVGWKEWISTQDERTRLSHANANGQVRKIDEPFSVGGFSLQQPGDSTLGAPADEIIFCRCAILPRFDDPNGEDETGDVALSPES